MDYITGITHISKISKKYELNNKIIGKRPKEFRKNNNMTQVQLANFLNTTQSTISAYESG